MTLFDAVNEVIKSLTEAHRQIASLQWSMDHSVVHGRVSDVDAKKHRCRLIIGTDEDGKDVKSPWVPYSQIAGTRKVHSPPSKGQQMTLLALNGDYSQALAVPFTWSDNNPSPSEKGDEDIDLRGKSRRTQRDADVKQEVDGLTVHHTKQSTSVTVHKDPQSQQDGQGEEVSDKKPWKGNRAKAKHKRTINKDAGYSLKLNDGEKDNEHSVIVHPDGKIEHSIKGGKHKVTIDGNKIETSWDKGKHKVTVNDQKIESSFDNGQHKSTVSGSGIAHSVDGGAQEVQINSMSGGLGSMAGGQLPNLLGGANLGALSNQLRSLLGSGALSGILGGGGGGVGGLLGGQLSGLLGTGALSQLTTELSSQHTSGQLPATVGGANGGVGGLLGGQLGGLLGPTATQNLTTQLGGLISSGGIGGLLGGGGGGVGGLLSGQIGSMLSQALVSQLTSGLSSALGSGSLGGMLQPGIVHKSSSTVKIESPQIEHQGNLMVTGSLMTTKTVQAPGFIGNLQGIASGIGFVGGLTPPTSW